ncbi:MAG: hypothetical protein ACXADS_09050 [Candidatus Thorarchaeota archaeon]
MEELERETEKRITARRPDIIVLLIDFRIHTTPYIEDSRILKEVKSIEA